MVRESQLSPVVVTKPAWKVLYVFLVLLSRTFNVYRPS